MSVRPALVVFLATSCIDRQHRPPKSAYNKSHFLQLYLYLCQRCKLACAGMVPLSRRSVPLVCQWQWGLRLCTGSFLQRAGSQAALLSPSYLRDFIQSHAAQAESAVRAERGRAAALLSYCLQDIDDSDADSCSALRGGEPWHPGMWAPR